MDPPSDIRIVFWTGINSKLFLNFILSLIKQIIKFCHIALGLSDMVVCYNKSNNFYG